MRNPIVVIASASLVACTPVDPDGPVDEDGDPIPLPGPYDTFLEIESITPGEGDALGPRPWLALRFNAYLDDDTFSSFGAMQLRAGGLRQRGDVRYVMTDRTLYWRPYSDLRDGFVYELDLTLGGVESVTGAPLREPDALPVYTADADAESAPFGRADDPVTFDEVDAVFQARCASCHGTPEWPYLVPLDRESLLTTTQPNLGRVMVRAGDPADSYLMHKVLEDYPDRLNGPCPPTWSEDPTPLTRDEVWLIERWIASPD
jgi:hypothetical protein